MLFLRTRFIDCPSLASDLSLRIKKDMSKMWLWSKKQSCRNISDWRWSSSRVLLVNKLNQNVLIRKTGRTKKRESFRGCLITHYTIKMYGWMEVEVHAFLTSALERTEGSASHPSYSVPGVRTTHQVYKRLGGLSSRYGCGGEEEKNLCLD
jgi:hypothetical protein